MHTPKQRVPDAASLTPRERVVRALRFQRPDRAPRELWALPGVTMGRKAEFDEFNRRWPGDFGGPGGRYGASRRAEGTPGEIGSYTDEWGSVWHVSTYGVVGEVKEPAIPDWSTLARYELPTELLDEADFSEVNRVCAESTLFIKAGTMVRPFERLQFLRGSENLFYDLAYGVRELFQLRDRLHDFFLRELAMWAKTDVDGISLMDDWGAQHALLISPAQWRDVFKPLYRDYVAAIHAAGKFAFMHSDGFIEAIYPDLIEIGVDALNSQLFCMNLERLSQLYKGKITFWGEIDRQRILPFGTPEECREAVWRVRRALDDGTGGLIAECEWGVKDPRENIYSVFETWEQPRSACPRT